MPDLAHIYGWFRLTFSRKLRQARRKRELEKQLKAEGFPALAAKHAASVADQIYG